MSIRIVVWSFEQADAAMVSTFERLVGEGSLEVVAYLGSASPELQRIASAPVIQLTDLANCEFDYLAIYDKNYCSIMADEVRWEFNVPLAKSLSFEVLMCPQFNLDDYLELKRTSRPYIDEAVLATMPDAPADAPYDEPKTSVIIPVYNTEDYLPACLNSVLSQTQQDIEVILVDDGSTDGSLAIELAYAAHDPRVRVIQQENMRQGAARNRGLEEARGRFVYYMDSDDIIAPQHLETCYEACVEHELDVLTFDSAGFEDDPNQDLDEHFPEVADRSQMVSSEIVDGITFWMKYNHLGQMRFICWLYYFDRKFLLENNLQFVGQMYFEDNDWAMRVMMAAKRIMYRPSMMHRYRHRPGSSVRAGFKPKLAEEAIKVHDVLRELALHEENPACCEMLLDTSHMKDWRFRQLQEVVPDDGLRTAIEEFVQRMMAECSDERLPDTVRMMDAATLYSLKNGVWTWPEFSVSFDKGTIAKGFFPFLPTEEQAPRIGIYGMGEGALRFLTLFPYEERECVFLDGKATPGREVLGRPVVSLEDVAEQNLDAILITSSKYATEISENIRRVLGDDIPLYVIPWKDLVCIGEELMEFLCETQQTANGAYECWPTRLQSRLAKSEEGK